MARSAGVEPATARFVAEYSIQLSYERKGVIIAIFQLKVKKRLRFLTKSQPIHLDSSFLSP